MGAASFVFSSKPNDRGNFGKNMKYYRPQFTSGKMRTNYCLDATIQHMSAFVTNINIEVRLKMYVTWLVLLDLIFLCVYNQ